MIPKIIHYSWFSNDPIPIHIQNFMETWKKFLPTYEFILWDGAKLAEVNNAFANEAVSVKKWAFASDFLRFYVIYNYGGIWFDTDIEVFKTFDKFLDNRVFISREANVHGHGKKERWLTAHCFGSEKGHPLIKDCLDFYTQRRFIRTTSNNFPQELQFDLTISPQVIAAVAKNYGYDNNGFVDCEEIIDEGIHIYPSDYFDSPQYKTMKRVHSIHREAGGWRPNNEGKSPNFKGTNPKKGRIFNYLKVLFQQLLLLFNISIIRIR